MNQIAKIQFVIAGVSSYRSGFNTCGSFGCHSRHCSRERWSSTQKGTLTVVPNNCLLIKSFNKMTSDWQTIIKKHCLKLLTKACNFKANHESLVILVLLHPFFFAMFMYLIFFLSSFAYFFLFPDNGCLLSLFWTKDSIHTAGLGKGLD